MEHKWQENVREDIVDILGRSYMQGAQCGLCAYSRTERCDNCGGRDKGVSWYPNNNLLEEMADLLLSAFIMEPRKRREPQENTSPQRNIGLLQDMMAAHERLLRIAGRNLKIMEQIRAAKKGIDLLPDIPEWSLEDSIYGDIMRRGRSRTETQPHKSNKEQSKEEKMDENKIRTSHDVDQPRTGGIQSQKQPEISRKEALMWAYNEIMQAVSTKIIQEAISTEIVSVNRGLGMPITPAEYDGIPHRYWRIIEFHTENQEEVDIVREVRQELNKRGISFYVIEDSDGKIQWHIDGHTNIVPEPDKLVEDTAEYPVVVVHSDSLHIIKKTAGVELAHYMPENGITHIYDRHRVVE